MSLNNEKLDKILQNLLRNTVIILLVLLTVLLIIFICLFGFYWIWFPWNTILFFKMLGSAVLAFLLICLLVKIADDTGILD